MSPILQPAICFGAVIHTRRTPVTNRFAYPVFFLRLPLSSWTERRRWPLSIDRPGLMSVWSRDYGGRDGGDLRAWVAGVLSEHGIEADGEVILQTLPRLFGYVFNPVSFWFCHDRNGDLRAVLCEVNNTFGERHNYLVAHADGSPIRGDDLLVARKVFHVSPFLPVKGEYRFRFSGRGNDQQVAIDYWEDDIERLATRIGGKISPLDRPGLLRALARFPLQSFAVMVRIHFQALRLWLRRVPFHSKPIPPLTETTR
jgi:hypothetical protein